MVAINLPLARPIAKDPFADVVRYAANSRIFEQDEKVAGVAITYEGRGTECPERGRKRTSSFYWQSVE